MPWCYQRVAGFGFTEHKNIVWLINIQCETKTPPIQFFLDVSMGCGESIKDSVFGGSVLEGWVFLTSDDLINRIPKTKPLKTDGTKKTFLPSVFLPSFL